MNKGQEQEVQTEVKQGRKIALFDNLIWLYIETIGLMIGGQFLGQFLISLITALLSEAIPDIYGIPEWITASSYIYFIGIWILGLVCIGCSKKHRDILKELWTKPSGNKISMLVLGLVIGFGLNGICILIAYLNHDIALTFDAFHPVSLLLIFLCVFVQSAAEEFLCRGFLYQRLRKRYRNPLVAIIGSSLLFAIGHLFNEGVTVLAVMNIVLVGILFAMMVYYLDSIWCAFAVHAAWNFTQNIIFGLPNSGIVVPYSVWKLDAGSARDSFAYNVGFGIEGTIAANAVLLLACIVLFVYGQKKKKSSVETAA